MRSPTAPLTVALSDLEKSHSMSLRFRSLTSHKLADLGNILLLNVTGKPYMGSVMEPLDLILSDLERAK